jgi:hypothetical protein
MHSKHTVLFVAWVSTVTVAFCSPPTARQLPAGPPVVANSIQTDLPAAGKKPTADQALFAQINQAEQVMVGTLTNVQWGPVGRSHPPMYTAQLTFVPKRVLRGLADPARAGKALAPITISYSRRGQKPKFNVGGQFIACLKHTRGRTQLDQITPLDDRTLAIATRAVSVPVGVTREKDGAIPPMRLLGAAVTLKVAKKPPAQAIKWTNPDGDGEYELTVTNTSKKPVQVQALRVDRDGQVLWNDCVKTFCNGTLYLLPASGIADAKTKPLTLAAGSSVSGTVNLFAMQDGGKIRWPRGGYRVEFRIALGEKAATKSFYYLSRHHDAIRAAAQKK